VPQTRASLGTIYSETSRLEEAAQAFGRYAAECPTAADAFLQQGKVLARQSRAQDARAAFQRCAEVGKEKDPQITDECARFLKEMGAP
jgi:TolA-binding protein